MIVFTTIAHFFLFLLLIFGRADNAYCVFVLFVLLLTFVTLQLTELHDTQMGIAARNAINNSLSFRLFYLFCWVSFGGGRGAEMMFMVSVKIAAQL